MDENLIQRILGKDFSGIEGANLIFVLAVPEAPINIALAALQKEELRDLEIDCLTDNQARVRVFVEKKVFGKVCFSLSRELLVEISGGFGQGLDGVVLLHIQEGFSSIVDKIAKKFAGLLNRNLPDSVRFIVEKNNDHFRIDINQLLLEPEFQPYARLLKKLTFGTKDKKLRIAIELSA